MDADTLQNIIDAAGQGQWALFAGLLLTVLVCIVNTVVMRLSKTKKAIPKVYLPWISSGLGVVGSIATALVAGQPWYSAVWLGLVVGATASGLWSLVGKSLDRGVRRWVGSSSGASR